MVGGQEFTEEGLHGHIRGEDDAQRVISTDDAIGPALETVIRGWSRDELHAGTGRVGAAAGSDGAPCGIVGRNGQIDSRGGSARRSHVTADEILADAAVSGV